MQIKVTYTQMNVTTPRQVISVYQVAPFGIPSGITNDVLTEAGSMVVALGASNPSETGAPSADGQAWVSDLAEPLKGRWQAVATSGGGSVELTNKSGSTQTAGTIVIFDKSNSSAFKVSSNLQDRRVAGVLEADTVNNSVGSVAVIGKLVTVNVQGNVAIGDWLVQSSTSGRASSYGIVKPSSGGIGVAMTAYSGGGAGTVTALVYTDVYSAYLPIETLGTAVSNSASSTTVSVTHTLASGSNRIALAFVALQTNSVTGVTYGGVAMTQLGTVNNGTEKLYVYYLLESSMPANGSKTVTATFNSSSGGGISVFTLQNVKQSAPSTPVTNSSGGASYLSASVSVGAQKSWAISVVFATIAGSFTHDSGQVEVTDYFLVTSGIGTMATSYEECGTGTNTQGSTGSAAGRMNFIATVIEPV